MSKRYWPLYTLTPLALAVMIGCSSHKPQTLGSLRYTPEADAPEQTHLARTTAQSVRADYQELLDIVDDEHLKEQIERRIAHVYMLEGEQDDREQQYQREPGKSYYLEAIKSYREILEKYPNSPDNADILYQLAKAYDMEGDQEEALKILRELSERHPGYQHIAEANFRKGDILFNLDGYREAEAAYLSVTTHKDSSFHLNAHYMLGWSRYKQLKFREALNDFVYVLNTLLASGSTLESLTKPNQSLVEDTLHAVSLSLDKLAGAPSIQTIPELNRQHYVWRVYDNLGTYYLEKELFEASAQSYREFITHHGNSDIAPGLHRKLIDTYIKGSFPRQAFTEKEQFVEAYGIYSNYARRRGGIPPFINDTMQEYLDELARNYHARGQELQGEIEGLTANEQQRAPEDKLEELDTEGVAAFNKAAYYYQQFLDTFHDYDQRDEFIFLRAEALFAARRYDESIPEYERVAYRAESESAIEHGADAGYAAIVAYERHLATLNEDDPKQDVWRSEAANSMLRFADRYHQDARSAAVLTNAAEYIFGLDQYERALHVAKRLLNEKENLDPELKKTAYGVSAHSLFRMKRYAEASEDYRLQRELVPAGSQEYTEITERLASAVYRHAEDIIGTGDKAAAVQELLRLKSLTPNSPVRITAQYDAASLLLELEQWQAAISELREMVERYPQHELAVEFPRKLSFAYEQNEDWRLAGEEYLKLSESDPDPDLKREALYLAATMFENAKDYPTAIVHFRDYAHTYPEPFPVGMEARFKLAQNYQRINDNQRRLFWLDKIVEGHRDAGTNATERSRYLAAWANAEYGDHYANEFRRLNIFLPLGQSLPAKNRQLERATLRYQMAADSGLLEFVTMSSFRIAELYQRFARELRESPRPPGLNADERQLYSEIIEEQAIPFDELAMDLHQSNIERAWEGEFDSWIDESFARMRELNPRRYAKTEVIVSYGDEIR